MDYKYLYFGKLVDFKGRNIGVEDKKIGITNNLDFREKELSRTKSPIKFLMIYAWKIEEVHCSVIERILHEIFGNRNTNGEYFEDEIDGEELINVLRWYLERFRELGISINEVKVTEILRQTDDPKLKKIVSKEISLNENKRKILGNFSEKYKINALLIRLKIDLSNDDTKLYEKTRKAWRLSKRKMKADYAISLHKGIIRAVYTIYKENWSQNASGRWMFEGVLNRELCDALVGKELKLPGQSPILYLNCD